MRARFSARLSWLSGITGSTLVQDSRSLIVRGALVSLKTAISVHFNRIKDSRGEISKFSPNRYAKLTGKCAVSREDCRWGAHLPFLGLEPAGG